MLNSEFAEWLYGYCKLGDDAGFTPRQLWIIKNHLNLAYAVEGYLDARNQWLDEAILALVDGATIHPPSPALSVEIRERYLTAD